jgi:hypothetical protein
MAFKVGVDPSALAKGGSNADFSAAATRSANNVDIDGSSLTKSVNNVDISGSGRSVSEVSGGGGALSTLRNLPPVKFLTNKFSSLRKTDVNKASADAAAVRSKPSTTPVPEAKQREVVSNNLDVESPDGQAALKNADDLAKEPSVSKTLQKWGVRGGVGVLFLMLLYKKANPIEAIEEAGKDTKDAVEGLSEFLNSIFEALKTLLSFLTQNWMVSAASSCCCVLLIVLPMVMGGARSIAPRRPYY